MNSQKLDAMLNKLILEPLPQVPASLEADVFRQIRLADERHESRLGWAWLLNPWMVPRAAVACLGVALLAGFLAGTLLFRSKHSTVSASLGMEVFSAYSPHLPSTRLHPVP